MSENQIEQSPEDELNECEQVLAGHMEEFVRVGMALKKIRDKKLYKVKGFETFEAYCKRVWELTPQHCNYKIMAADVRLNLPNLPEEISSDGWRLSHLNELKRLDSPAKQKAVAAKVIREVEKSEVKLTASLVRKHVDKELGVERKNLTKEEREAREPDFNQTLSGWLGDLRGIADVLRNKVTPEALADWAQLSEENGALAYAFARAIEDLRELWEVKEIA